MGDRWLTHDRSLTFMVYPDPSLLRGGVRARQFAVHQDRSDDSGARRREAAHRDLRATRRARAPAHPAGTHALRCDGGRERLAGALCAPDRRWVHLRIPGYPRTLHVRRPVRDAAAGARQARSQSHRRKHRYLRHHPMAARQREGSQRTRRHPGDFLRRLADYHGLARSAPRAEGASEQASPADMFLGDDFHHNGAFRISYGFEYAALLETSKETNTNFAFDRADTYQWYLTLGALPNADENYFHGKIPTWNDF